MKLSRTGGAPVGVGAGIVTPGLFSTLDVRAAAGRLFTPADLAPSERHVVVLSDELWRSQFAAAPDIALSISGVGRVNVSDRSSTMSMGPNGMADQPRADCPAGHGTRGSVNPTRAPRGA